MDFMKLCFTAGLSALVLFVIAKVIGHKQMSQLDFFDYITGITIGSIGAELATDLEEPWKPLVAMVVYGLITVVLSFVTSKFAKSRRLINGIPIVVMNNGKLDRKNMKKAKLDLSEFLMMCRQAGYFDLEDVQTAVFEYNGRLSVLPKSACRPATPADFYMKPEAAAVNTEVIMDGRVMNRNLQALGLDEVWLKRELERLGHKKPDGIFLGLCNKNKKLTLYKK